MIRVGKISVKWMLALLALASAASCGDDGGSSVGDAGDWWDAGGDVAFRGKAKGGVATSPPPVDAGFVDPGPVTVMYPCCEVTLSLPDDGRGHLAGRVRGNMAPLNAAGGVALTLVGNQWTAKVCLPTEITTQYHFEFDLASVPDAGIPDAGGDDGGSDPDANAVDADVSDLNDPDAAEEGEVVFDPKRFVRSDLPRTLDNDRKLVNLFYGPATCDAP